MLPNYTIYRLTKDFLIHKKGYQIIHVHISVPRFTEVYLMQGSGQISGEDFKYLDKNGFLKEVAHKGSSTPLSQIHPDILKFYQDQLGLSNHYTSSDIKELRTMFGEQYITDSLSRMASTLHSISDSTKPTIIPTIVGKAWYDFVVSMENVGNLAIIPAIIEELSKVTLKELEGDVNSLEVEITGYYKIYFDILSVIGKVVILKIRLLEPA